MSTVPTKKEVAAAIVRAATPKEFEAARELRQIYLDEFPDDADVLEMGETLTLLQQTIKAIENPPANGPAPGRPGSYNGVIEPKP